MDRSNAALVIAIDAIDAIGATDATQATQVTKQAELDSFNGSYLKEWLMSSIADWSTTDSIGPESRQSRVSEPVSEPGIGCFSK